jgi:hypothetical protein
MLHASRRRQAYDDDRRVRIFMYRLTGFLVALVIAMFPANLAAQRGGGARVGGGAAHVGGGGARVGGGFAGRSGPGVSTFRGSGSFGRAPFRSFARPVVVAPFGFGFGGFGSFYSPFYSPFSSYSSPYDWGAPYAGTPYESSPYMYSDPAPAPSYSAPAADASAGLAYQVGQLSQQIAELRAEQAARASQSPLSGSAHYAQTVLVYKDGHRQEIQNYAIVGQTLWIFDEHASTRISLSDLDLAATQNENRQRGNRFSVPEK